MRLRIVLPQNQLGPEVKDVIRLVTGLLVTMTALVLGMLVSIANSSYQQRKDQLTEMASDFVGVDRLLGSYGPETEAAREELHSFAEASLQRIWPLSLPLLLVVVAWLTAIFVSFGLFAPRNSTVFVTLVVCAAAVSGAVFVIMAMYTPFSGVMKISSLPLRDALIRMTP
jgi:hypothetical protein